MITIKRVKQESRPRDKKRGRFILVVGKHSIHISDDELRKLVSRGFDLLVDSDVLGENR